MKGGNATLTAVVVAVMMVVAGELQVANAVTCSPTELAPCLSAIISSQPPTAACCNKLREQKPCLCGYIRDPNLKQYVNSAGAKRTANICRVTIPNC